MKPPRHYGARQDSPSSRRRLAAISVAGAMLAITILASLAGAQTPTPTSQPTRNQPSKATPRVAVPANTPTLDLTDFLKQVSEGNGAFEAARLSKSSADATALEPGLQLKPNFIAGASMTSDAKPSPFFPYQRLETSNYYVGVANQFAFGLNAKFTYNFADYHYVGIAPQYFEGRPQLEATFPLWRNLFGRESTGNIEAAIKGAQAKSAAQDATGRSVILEAEAAYWRLALSREALKISKASVDRAQAMFDWTNRRVRLSLSDRAENLQSIAQLKARKLDLIQAQDDERAASLSFNAARGVAGDKVSETLPTLTSALISKWQAPARHENRPDVVASIRQAEATEAQANAAGERTKPNLELFGSYAFNSPQRPTDNAAFNDSWSSNRPTSTVGVRLNMPLDIGSANQVSDGWKAEAMAAKALATRKQFEQERDWRETLARFELSKEKVKLYEDLESAQREKLDHERSRQKGGRSTVAQVILFESDFDQTQFSRVRALAELLNLNAQLKLYGAVAAGN